MLTRNGEYRCRHRVPARLPRLVQSGGDPQQRPRHRDRKFGDRVYGDARLQYPAVRTGPKGQGRFRRIDWDEAIELIATRMLEVREHWGGEAILPFSYGGSRCSTSWARCSVR